ncbi:MAG: class I SAM-dependent methyltransferase, partial [Bacteroidia bacterium]|nr:class I SAM-dependent methyltransferase [Bacteroidia bacterium]
MMASDINETVTSDYYPNNLEYYDYIYLDHLKYSKKLLNDLIPVFRQFKVETVFDACCGSGNDIIQLQKNGFIVNASDLCQKMIDFTKSRFTKSYIDKASFFTANVLNLSKSCSSKFDLILFRGNTLGHLTSDNQLKAIDELV